MKTESLQYEVSILNSYCCPWYYLLVQSNMHNTHFVNFHLTISFTCAPVRRVLLSIVLRKTWRKILGTRLNSCIGNKYESRMAYISKTNNLTTDMYPLQFFLSVLVYEHAWVRYIQTFGFIAADIMYACGKLASSKFFAWEFWCNLYVIINFSSKRLCMIL